MSVSGVQVEIFEGEKRIYERETVKSDEDGLKTLLRDLREVQVGINTFLTELIEQRDASGGTQNTTGRAVLSRVEPDSDTDEEKEEEGAQVNPKKCKLST